ncbi:carbamoyl-phosphate synthase L chain, ATP binding domain-containing protein [Paraphysoderma sedebokerense]|nr:carbamoyl-phosphate synthase L chain, ATP binding domain-containing protein [Paraphysoderma sedebokerense]
MATFLLRTRISQRLSSPALSRGPVSPRFYVSAASPHTRNPLFDKILIANRGEIACRVMKTAQRLGIKCVAVYSEADKHSMHVKMADEAYLLGPAPSAESYLRMDKIIDIAKRTGAQAIHPGYGFLSENADFADLLAKEQLTFIGPPAQAIIDMGSKSASKNIMQKANVPVVPGYHGSNQDPKFLKEQASKIGFPVLIKAIKGGGGKGMRIVESESDFDMMLESAKREAQKSFGDDRVLVEKYLVTPRHVEVQVFADKLGNAVHLFERDCSVQRRHQKIIEEAPGPGITTELRNSLGAKAVAAAKAVNYEGAGTVEFIMDNETKTFYFMEMNTRLQVEHPVTEMITNTDLVEWQLEVAAGNPLPLSQSQIPLDGHAFEARIYAETPTNNFLPDTGPLLHLSTPATSNSLRVETGVSQGDQVSVYYDPMIAKLVVKSHDRNSALKKLRRGLEEYHVVGLNTNIEFLKTLSAHPMFVEGDVETNFIKKHHSTLFPSPPPPSAESVLPAALSLILNEADIASSSGSRNTPSQDPWGASNGFRLNTEYERSVVLLDNRGKEVEVTVKFLKDGKLDAVVKSPESTTEFPSISIESFNKQSGKQSHPQGQTSAKGAESVKMTIDLPNKKINPKIVTEGNGIVVFSNNHPTITFQIPTPAYITSTDHSSAEGSVKAPMPCKISGVLVKEGERVEKGKGLVVLEAMKMEHMIKAPYTGTVKRINYQPGELVEEGKLLVVFERESEENSEEK